MKYGQGICSEEASELLRRGVETASTLGVSVAIAVVDTGGHLVAFLKMNDTHIGSVQVSQDKARSAVLFRRSTKVFQDSLQSGEGGMRVLTLTGAVAVEGGMPILREGCVVGGFGVSGGTPEQDGQVAAVALASGGELVLDGDKTPQRATSEERRPALPRE